MQAILLRVGIDKGRGGQYAPIFEDGSFEFIPIPCEKTSEDARGKTYKDKVGRTGKPLSDYVRPAIENCVIHDDPEFETFTYGDDTIKAHRIGKLEPNDLLVFYAGLTPWPEPFMNGRYKSGLYIVGYFTIERIIDFNNLQPGEMDLCSRNTHIAEKTTKNLVVAKGVKDRSRLLDRAISISQKCEDRARRTNLHVSKEMESLLGISGSIQRSIPPRFIRSEEGLTNLRSLIGL
jgi:hypothetical protein